MVGEPKFGIIACEMFEDHLVKLIENDGDVDEVLIIENEQSSRLIDKFTGVKAVDIESEKLDSDTFKNGNIILELKEMALHKDIDDLREKTRNSCSRLQRHVDLILLFYGLCGNAFERVDRLMAGIDVPVLILKDKEGGTVPDCIASALGSNKKYLELTMGNPGSFFLTSMWAEYWKEMFQKVRIMRNSNDLEGAKIVLDHAGYERVVKIEDGVGEKKTFEENVRKFQKIFGLDRADVEGSINLLRKNYEHSKLLAETQFRFSSLGHLFEKGKISPFG